METGVILSEINDVFSAEMPDIRTYSPLTLAYIGDAVYELVIRSLVVERGSRPVNELHHLTTGLVNAGAQAGMLRRLLELDVLTDEEADVVRRGRNAKPYTTAKNATRSDYHKATGFEALMGYLYLTGREQRMLELIRTAIDETPKETGEGE